MNTWTVIIHGPNGTAGRRASSSHQLARSNWRESPAVGPPYKGYKYRFEEGFPIAMTVKTRRTRTKCSSECGATGTRSRTSSAAILVGVLGMPTTTRWKCSDVYGRPARASRRVPIEQAADLSIRVEVLSHRAGRTSTSGEHRSERRRRRRKPWRSATSASRAARHRIQAGEQQRRQHLNMVGAVRWLARRHRRRRGQRHQLENQSGQNGAGDRPELRDSLDMLCTIEAAVDPAGSASVRSSRMRPS